MGPRLQKVSAHFNVSAAVFQWISSAPVPSVPPAAVDHADQKNSDSPSPVNWRSVYRKLSAGRSVSVSSKAIRSSLH